MQDRIHAAVEDIRLKARSVRQMLVVNEELQVELSIAMAWSLMLTCWNRRPVELMASV